MGRGLQTHTQGAHSESQAPKGGKSPGGRVSSGSDDSDDFWGDSDDADFLPFPPFPQGSGLANN